MFETITAALTALADLLTGDYTAPLFTLFGWHEDHPAVDLILTARGY